MPTRYDIAIIGAGIAGLSAAYFLSRDANVVVLEQESQPAYHTSGRSAALFIGGYENSDVAELTQASAGFLHQPPPGFSPTPLLQPRGGLNIARHGEEAALAEDLTTWQAYCPDRDEIEVQACLEMCPILREELIGAATYDAGMMTIDAHALLEGYRKGLVKNGGQLLTEWQVSEIRNNNRWSVTTRSGGHLETDILINAAGCWASTIGELAGAAPMQLQPLRRTAAIIDAPAEASTWPVVHTIANDLYFKPEAPGLMVCGQDETPSEPMDAYPHDIDIAVAMDRFTGFTTLPVSRVAHQWAGLRTFSADRRPVLGFDHAAPRFFWLAGQGGFGIQTSAGLGRLTADAILHETSVPPALSCKRFT